MPPLAPLFIRHHSINIWLTCPMSVNNRRAAINLNWRVGATFIWYRRVIAEACGHSGGIPGRQGYCLKSTRCVRGNRGRYGCRKSELHLCALRPLSRSCRGYCALAIGTAFQGLNLWKPSNPYIVMKSISPIRRFPIPLLFHFQLTAL